MKATFYTLSPYGKRLLSINRKERIFMENTNPPKAASRMFQISGEDLVTLEREIPALVERMWVHLNNRDRTQIRQVQKILMDIRWNYGPPTEIHQIPVGGE